MRSERRATQRLHPSSLLFSLLGYLRTLVVPALIVIFVTGGERWERWAAVFVVPAMIFETYRYVSLRYRLGRDELVVTTGVITRNERHVPFARIQNIDTKQTALQRAVGVAEVRIETGGGSEPEATFKVLSVAHVDEMRAHVFGHTADAAEDDAQASTRVIELSRADLYLMSINPARGLAVVAAGLGVAWELDAFEKISGLGWVVDFVTHADTALVTAAVGFGGAMFVVLLFLLSMLWTFLRLHGFRLERSGEDFRLQCGLLTRHTATVPRHRVQFVSVRQSPLLRLLGRASIRIETAGAVGEHDEAKTIGRRWFVPLVKLDQLQRVLAEVVPDLRLADVPWQPLAPRARRRMLKRALVVSILASTLVQAMLHDVLFPGVVGLLALLIVLPFALWQAHLNWGFTRWARTDQGVFYRSGAWVRKTSLALIGKVQDVSRRQSPFDRRYDMASLRVDTAGAGPAGHRVDVAYLPLAVAEGLRHELVTTLQGSEFRW